MCYSFLKVIRENGYIISHKLKDCLPQSTLYAVSRIYQIFQIFELFFFLFFETVPLSPTSCFESNFVFSKFYSCFIVSILNIGLETYIWYP